MPGNDPWAAQAMGRTDRSRREIRQAALMNLGVDRERAAVVAGLLDLPGESAAVLASIVAERRRQIAKFGDQSGCPDADPTLLDRVGRAELDDYGAPEVVARRLAIYYSVPAEHEANAICEGERSEGSYTWFGIALEEVAEALAAIPQAVATDDPEVLLAEVEQCAAVFTAWAEAIRRRGVKRDRTAVADGQG